LDWGQPDKMGELLANGTLKALKKAETQKEEQTAL